MILIRPVHWPADAAALASLDTSFTTDRIYELERQPFAFTLAQRSVSPPLTKTISHLDEELDAIRKMQHTVVAEVNQTIVGLAAAHYSAWNGRVVLWHLYVQPARRGSTSITPKAREGARWPSTSRGRSGPN